MTESDVKSAAACIRAGGVLAYPTEAVYGLGCDPHQLEAVKRVLSLKSRESHKGLILIASQWQQLEPWVAPLSDDIHSRAIASWPGPVTWVLPAAKSVNPLISGFQQSVDSLKQATPRTTIAVRISSHPVVKKLCDACEHALVSTSANVSGQPALTTAAAVDKAFGARLDMIVAGELGGLSRPTSIFDGLSGKQLR